MKINPDIAIPMFIMAVAILFSGLVFAAVSWTKAIGQERCDAFCGEAGFYSEAGCQCPERCPDGGAE